MTYEMNAIPNLPLPIFLILIGGMMLLLAFAKRIKIKNFIDLPAIPLAGRILFGIFGGSLFILGVYLVLPFPIGRIAQMEILIDKPQGDIYTNEEHVAITVEGRIVDIPENIKTDRLYVLIRPLESDLLFVQDRAAPAAEKWTVRAYLGGTGEHCAKHDEKFDIIAIVTKTKLEAVYNSLQELPQRNTYLSSPVTLTVKRK